MKFADAILLRAAGFSQGATAAALFLAGQKNGTTTSTLKFAILVCSASLLEWFFLALVVNGTKSQRFEARRYLINCAEACIFNKLQNN